MPVRLAAEAAVPAYVLADRPGRGAERLLDLLWPPRCVACGAWGAWLCAACVAALDSPRPPLCRRCGWPSPGATLCAACRRGPSYVLGIRSVAPYLPPLREAIHALKYDGMRVLVDPLSQLLAQLWEREVASRRVPRIDAVLPVPLHPTRVRYRGYNQSALLAAAFARLLRLPYHEDWVVRSRRTRSQVGLSPGERWSNVWQAFTAQGPLSGTRLLLVDDVMTTGATLEACAYTLREAGAAEVWALTVARASRRRATLPPGTPGAAP